MTSADQKSFNDDADSGNQDVDRFKKDRSVVVMLAKGYFTGKVIKVSKRSNIVSVLLDSLENSELIVNAPPISVISSDEFSMKLAKLNDDDDDL